MEIRFVFWDPMPSERKEASHAGRFVRFYPRLNPPR